jgi:hypothetical protein
MKNRYQIVTYSHDSGADAKLETDTLKAARQLVYVYMTEGEHNTGRSFYDGACIYDHQEKTVREIYNDFDQDRIISAPNRNPDAIRFWIANVNHD